MTTSSVSPVTTELAGSETGITLVIHAGAGSRGKHSTPERIAQVELDLQRALDAGYQLLESGAPAHEAVVAAIHVMEDASEFNAGPWCRPDQRWHRPDGRLPDDRAMARSVRSPA